MARIPDCACLDVRYWVLNEIWIIDLSSALVFIVMRSSKLFLFFEQSSFKPCCETVIEIVLCYSHHACCILQYLCEITSNNGFHIYLSGCNCTVGFEQKYWRIDGFGKKGTDRRNCIPLVIPPNIREFGSLNQFKGFLYHNF